jgi:hypothetical protein
MIRMMTAMASQVAALGQMLNGLFPSRDSIEGAQATHREDLEDLMAECVFFVNRLNLRAGQYGDVGIIPETELQERARGLRELYTKMFDFCQRLLPVLRDYQELGIEVPGTDAFMAACADAEFGGPRHNQILTAFPPAATRTHAEVRDGVRRRLGSAS